MECSYYIYNGQGDVIEIIDSNGNKVAQYAYNAWGLPLSVKDGSGNTVSATNSTHIANLNPFRYRGYYYDIESGFYYLQSRYYDPQTCRFINADAYVSTGQGVLGTNMFAYCGNNPVNLKDDSGQFWLAVIGIGVLVTGMIFGCTSSSNEKNINPCVALGSVKTGKTQTGYTYDIHPPKDSTKTQRHIHIEKGKEKYSQNEDGTRHDKGKNNPGSPPNSVKKELKNKGIWDWDANEAKTFVDPNEEIQKFSFAFTPGPVHGIYVPEIAPAPVLPPVPAFG